MAKGLAHDLALLRDAFKQASAVQSLRELWGE
jgi:hypothetical protein